MTVSHTSISSIWSIEGTIRLGEIESMLSCFRRGNPWLLCAFDIRGYEACMRVHCSHLIAKWSRRSLMIDTFHMARRLFRIRRRRERSIGNRILDSVSASTEHRRRADSKRTVGGRRTNLTRIRSNLYKITPIGTLKAQHRKRYAL